jgi:hypothetical protein
VLVLVTVLFAVTWSRDSAHAAVCREHRRVACVASTAEILPVAAIADACELRTTVIVARVDVVTAETAPIQLLPMTSLPLWMQAVLRDEHQPEAVPEHGDWLSVLVQRAESGIGR